ncbi:MAG: Bifunctional protein Aas [Gammaproteobacteria bacterium]|nr:Bifunctional protein Aas [Gammaproteobacteria bacterium]
MIAFLVRMIGRGLCALLYRIEVSGVEHCDRAGDPVLVVANHTSLLDGALLYLYLPRAPVFAVQTMWAGKWWIRPFLRLVETVPFEAHDPMAVKAMVRAIREHGTAAIFPEGRMTTTGALMKIYEGTAVIAEKAGATILPVAFDGPQHTRFACTRTALRRRWRPRIRMIVLPAIAPAVEEAAPGHARRVRAARVIEQVMQQISYAAVCRDGTIFDAFLDALRLHGGRTIIAEDLQRRPVTGRSLLLRAFALGRLLSRQTRAGEHVGVMLPNSTGVIAVLLAMHSRGRVPAMLNFTAGSAALLTAVQTASIGVVCTSRQFVEKADLGEVVAVLGSAVKVIYLEDLAAHLTLGTRLAALLGTWFPAAAYRRCHPSRNAQDTAVILFTSGSEGVPKGVVLSHRNLLANCAQTQVLIGLNDRDLVFNALPVFHSFGLTAGLLLPMLHGARIFMYPTPLHHKIIPELCYQLGATVLFGTNSFLAAYAQSAHPYDFHTLRYAIAGAEKLQAETRRAWAERFGIRILEGYGATEASPVVSVNTPMANKPGTVGRLLTGIEYYLEPVEGMAQGGRLVIRGPNVMKGYLYHGSDGEIVPPATSRGAGWYDTGDIVEVDPDGYLQIVGRARRFAKVGGEMISLAVVEEIAAAAWPGESHAAVAVADTRKGEHIVLITRQTDADRRHFLQCAHRLGHSELHVPKRFVVVDALPLLGTGKLDYRRLMALAIRRGE